MPGTHPPSFPYPAAGVLVPPPIPHPSPHHPTLSLTLFLESANTPILTQQYIIVNNNQAEMLRLNTILLKQPLKISDKPILTLQNPTVAKAS